MVQWWRVAVEGAWRVAFMHSSITMQISQVLLWHNIWNPHISSHISSHVTPMYTHNVSPSHLKIYDVWVTMIPLTDCTKFPPNVHIFLLSLLKRSQRTPRDTFTHHLCPTYFHSGVTWEGHGSSIFLLDLDIRNIVYTIYGGILTMDIFQNILH